MRNLLTVLRIFALSIAMAGAAGAQSSPAAPAAGPSPIATADGEASGMQLQVTKLKREGNAVTLQFEIINNSDNPFSTNGTLVPVGECCRTDVSGVYLVDTPGKKKYEVMLDSDKNAVCSRDFGNIAPKSTVNLWAKFPAPPDSVQKVGVVVPHFIPMDDVPISQ
jgi:hypothetical protein